MSLDSLANGLINATAKIGWQAADLLKSKHKGATGGNKTPKTKRKAQRSARRTNRPK